MKVLVVLGGIAMEGISNIALSYLEAISKKQLKIYLAIAGPSDEMMLLRAEKIGVPIIQLPYRKSNFAKYYIALYKMIKREKFDVFHIHGNSATMAIDLFIAFLAGCRVRIPHCHNTMCSWQKMNKLLKPFLKLFMTKGFACGEMAGNWLFGKGNYKVIKNGRKVDRYLYNDNMRDEYRNKLELKSCEIAIGHVGTFSEQKNQKFIIEVMKKLKDTNVKYKLFLFGDGPLKYEVEKLVYDYNLGSFVVFMGEVHNVYDYLNAMDLMVLPSKYEGVPLVILEWQLNGLPCIISDKISDECVLSDDVKLLSIDENDVSVWCEEIIKFDCINREEKDQSSIINKIVENGFNIEHNAIELENEYIRLIKMKNKKGC